MSTRKTTIFYVLLAMTASLFVGMIIASRLDMTPRSSAQTINVPSSNNAPITGPLSAETFRNIAKLASPTVVNIRTTMIAKSQDLTEFFGGQGGTPDDFLHRFFGTPGQQDPDAREPRAPGERGRNRPQREPKAQASGTGFIISKDGFILTNNHVVEDATKIEVGLFGDDPDVTYQAKLIGRDQLTDSALIQLIDKPKDPLPEAKFGDSSQMAAGDWVMAIGNPFNYSHTVTIGVISAAKRAFPVSDGRTNDVMQTDAAINPGNSGGPLLNARGEVIGINTAIITNARSEGNIGIGFAVPINTVRDLLPQLRQGKIIRGRIGVSVTAVPREGYEDFGLKSRMGAIVASVSQGGAAQKAGMEPGDVVVQYNGRPVANRDELVSMVVATKPGTSVSIKVMRNRQEKTLNVTVEELDLDAEQNNGRPRSSQNNQDQPEEHGASGFGLTLENVTPADGPSPVVAVRPAGRGDHRRRSRRAGRRGAAPGRRDPLGQPQGGLLRPRSGRRIEEGAIGPPRAVDRLAGGTAKHSSR